MFKKLLEEKVVVIGDGGKDLTEKSLVLSLANDFEDAEWRHSRFQNFIWNNIAQTALSKRERESLAGEPHSLLARAAKSLRLTDKSNDVGAGSELAEAFLYGVMSHYFNALSVVPKIFYKQNSQDNAKGADSVHITVVDDTDFRLWFGECKFYNSIEDSRLSSIIESVGESLRSDKIKKENSIICNVSDLKELNIGDALKNNIESALSQELSLDELKPKLCIPIMLLHECAITAGVNSWSQPYEDEVTAFHRERAQTYLKKQLVSLGAKIHLYDSITFHVILFPVPDKAKAIKQFLDAVNFYRSQ
ncbi:MAG TPA: DUF1837 domain-containing protein [Dyella sp.]|nr:DUF1837 domain-containing protein [Dyella sp.]